MASGREGVCLGLTLVVTARRVVRSGRKTEDRRRATTRAWAERRNSRKGSQPVAYYARRKRAGRGDARSSQVCKNLLLLACKRSFGVRPLRLLVSADGSSAAGVSAPGRATLARPTGHPSPPSTLSSFSGQRGDASTSLSSLPINNHRPGRLASVRNLFRHARPNLPRSR